RRERRQGPPDADGDIVCNAARRLAGGTENGVRGGYEAEDRPDGNLGEPIAQVSGAGDRMGVAVCLSGVADADRSRRPTSPSSLARVGCAAGLRDGGAAV